MERLNYYIIDSIIFYAKQIVKQGPPGPPPRPGLDWKEETSRWVCPVEGCKEEVEHELHEPILGPSSIMNTVKDNLGWSKAIEVAVNHFDPTKEPSYVDDHNDSILTGYKQKQYEVINKALRNRDSKLSIDLQNSISHLIGLMKPIKTDQTLYRSMYSSFDGRSKDWVESMNPGDVLDIDAFMSTSRNPEVAGTFGNYFMELRLSDPDVVGITTNDTDKNNRQEFETIIGPGQKLRIDSIEENVKLPNRYSKVRFISATILL